MTFYYLTRFYMRNGWTLRNAIKTAWRVSRHV